MRSENKIADMINKRLQDSLGTETKQKLEGLVATELECLVKKLELEHTMQTDMQLYDEASKKHKGNILAKKAVNLSDNEHYKAIDWNAVKRTEVKKKRKVSLIAKKDAKDKKKASKDAYDENKDMLTKVIPMKKFVLTSTRNVEIEMCNKHKDAICVNVAGTLDKG